MTIDIWMLLGISALGLLAGLVGALLGLGGGIFLVPVLTLVFNLPFQVAAGTSLVAVAATSAAGSSTYVRTRLTNIRLAVLLGTATVAAAIGASLVAQAIDGRILRALFAFLLLYTAVTMIRGARPGALPAAQPAAAPSAPAPDGWNLGGSYQDARLGRVAYQATHVPLGMGASLLGGTISGLLGVGGGIVQVPVMHLLMGVPLKVATGTSSFLIGITAAARALIYYASGRIDPVLAAPAALAVFVGARLGAYLVQRLQSATLKRIFGVVALLVAVQMILQAVDACPWCPPGR